MKQVSLWKRDKKELKVDNLIISTVDSDINNTITPVLRAFKKILNVLDGSYFILRKSNIDDYEIIAEPKRIIQIYDTYYFPHYWLVGLYEKFKNSQIYYVSFDYLSKPFSAVAKIFEKRGIVISNAETIIGFKPYKFYFVNTNVLNLMDTMMWKNQRKRNIIYWGRYRPRREKYFRKYLKDVDISTTPKNIKKFERVSQNVRFVHQIDWKDPFITDYRASLYLEDPVTHKIFNYLGSRWYEAISCGLVTYFDTSCINTIKRSGYYIPKEFIVSDRYEIPSIIDVMEYRDIVEEWFSQALKEETAALAQLKEIFN